MNETLFFMALWLSSVWVDHGKYQKPAHRARAVVIFDRIINGEFERQEHPL